MGHGFKPYGMKSRFCRELPVRRLFRLGRQLGGYWKSTYPVDTFNNLAKLQKASMGTKEYLLHIDASIYR